ncbi:hypothetical protein HYQ44_005002, partial [Verticillium longisporum]
MITDPSDPRNFLSAFKRVRRFLSKDFLLWNYLNMTEAQSQRHGCRRTPEHQLIHMARVKSRACVSNADEFTTIAAAGAYRNVYITL